VAAFGRSSIGPARPGPGGTRRAHRASRSIGRGILPRRCSGGRHPPAARRRCGPIRPRISRAVTSYSGSQGAGVVPAGPLPRFLPPGLPGRPPARSAGRSRPSHSKRTKTNAKLAPRLCERPGAFSCARAAWTDRLHSWNGPRCQEPSECRDSSSSRNCCSIWSVVFPSACRRSR